MTSDTWEQVRKPDLQTETIGVSRELRYGREREIVRER